MTTPKSSLVFDISNLLYRVAAVQKATNPYARGATGDDLVGLCMHISLQSIQKWYLKFKPDFVVFAFEGGMNWRKQFSKDVNARREYKANRVVDPDMAHYYELIDSFKEVVEHHTSICCLYMPGMEADDSIAAYCELTAGTGEQVTIVSGDKDFIQLLKHSHVKLVEPDKGKYRNEPNDKDYEDDLDFWLFLKCFRGDSGDNVASAFPRVLKTRVRKAFDDPYERINLMNEKFTEGGVEYSVGKLFEQNRVLMDLTAQPAELRELLLEVTKEQIAKQGKYSFFHFMKFINKHKLNSVAKDINKFVTLFSHNQLFKLGQLPKQVELKKIDPEPEKLPSQLLFD